MYLRIATATRIIVAMIANRITSTGPVGASMSAEIAIPHVTEAIPHAQATGSFRVEPDAARAGRIKLAKTTNTPISIRHPLSNAAYSPKT